MSSRSTQSTSYGQILKSSSILGGAQGLNLLIAMGRTKIVAILLGPGGIGVVSLYQSLLAVMGTIAGLGVAASGVRQIAEACGTGDQERIARSGKILMRVSWVTGILGCLLTAGLSYPLCQWTFGSHEHALAIAILGLSLLLMTVSGGQMALIEGMRRIGDIARIQVLSMIASTAMAVGLYAWLKDKGIVPVLITSSIISFGTSWWYASKIRLIDIPLDWRQTWHGSKHMISLGLAFMWSAFVTSGVAFATRTFITRDLGIEANGIFQSAWGISGMFAGFILSAMGTDFYPRLTAASQDHTQMNKLVDEQTEIAILLAFPGLLATLLFAPLLMKIFYTAKFMAGATLLPWLVLGVFFKIVSWPMGYIQLAMGATRWFIASETLFGVLHLMLTLALLKILGLQGAAQAFALLYGIHICAMLGVSRKLSGFHWSHQTMILLLSTAMLVVAAFLLQKYADTTTTLVAGGALTAAAGVFSLRGIVKRLPGEHRIVRVLNRIPFAASLFGPIH